MPSLDADHSHFALNRHHQSPPPHNYDPPTQGIELSQISDSIPSLPSYTYTPPTHRRPPQLTDIDPPSANAEHSTPPDSTSPDPHDFYRPHQEPVGDGAIMGSVGQGAIRVEKRSVDGQRSNRSRLASPPSKNGNGPRLTPIASRIGNAQNASSWTADRSPLSATKSTPTLASTARNRQTSLKELVNKFNQAADEVPPLPQKPSSRSSSTNSLSTGKVPGARTASQSRGASGGISSASFPNDTTTLKGSKYKQQRRGRVHEGAAVSSKTRANRHGQPADAVPARPFASQSMVDLAPEIAALPRRPLFGEVLTSSPSSSNAGYGIQGYRRRRGSEGSMHSPNPMFPDQNYVYRRDPSPSSPSSWYLSAAPPLDQIKASGEIPEPPPNLHRRTRSDFQGVPSGPPASITYQTNLSPPSSPSSATNSRRSSQSRIPLSIRRLGTTSELGNSAPPRNNSALGNHRMKSPTHTRAQPPNPLQNPRTSPRYSRSTTPQKSPRYQQSTVSRPSTSPRLAAYISAPMPKKSPPLRSSRPRQPVSSASTSASRARAVEKFSIQENGGSRGTKDSRPKKPPELGAVDFAARRQKIQQAFTKTVKEEEEREIKRASMARESRSSGSFKADAGESAASKPNSSQNLSLQHDGDDDGRSRMPNEELASSERELTINTGQLSERSVLDLSTEDSPTLGTFNTRFLPHTSRTRQSSSTPNSDIEPGSAITAGTSDSVDTFFDDEPQEDSYNTSRRQSAIQPTLMTTIMTIRSSRTPSPTGFRRHDITEESASGDERDDRESIQIMLGATPVLEKGSFTDPLEDKPTGAPSNDGPDNRWSMDSWTSSIRSRDDGSAPMERIDEHSPLKKGAPAHLSLSSAASEQTQSAWSPFSFTSPKTDRTTMDSDAYSTINRVLDHYHDHNFSPEMVQDVQQHLLDQSPDLARQGGWDPKKVTQLYLQNLARNRNTQSSALPDAIRLQIQERTSSLTVPPQMPEMEVRNATHEVIVQSIAHSRNQSTSSIANHDVDDEGDLKPARASLNQPGDFELSPSLGGFFERASDVVGEEKPPLPEKNEQLFRNRLSVEDHGGPQYPFLDDECILQLPPVNLGQDIDIRVNHPQGKDSPVAQPPPRPLNSPPPPPVDAMEQSQQALMPTSKPSITEPADKVWPRRPVTSPKPLELSSFSKEGQSLPIDATSKNSSPSPDQKRLTRRRHIIKELVDTEHSFGQDMKVVDDIYKGTSNVIIISAEDVKTLFSNSDQIVSFSTTFLDALKGASKSVYVLPKSKRWRSNRVSNATSYSGNTGDESSLSGVELSEEDKDRKTFIGEAFGHHMVTMEKVYADYLKNHDAANQKLQQLQKNPKVQIWLKECKAYASDLTSAWDLDSLLVKPVQRVLKYPLLLDQLLEVTPENHPDYTALDVAAREMKGISMRINEMKKRADIMEQVTSTNRKRKESDMRVGLAKAFGRRAEKLKQQVGTAGMFDDKAYAGLSEKFAEHFVRLQVVMRDVEMYTGDVELFVRKFCTFAEAMETHIDVGQTSYPELESKWRKFRMSMREMSATALADHLEQVRKYVVLPMTTLVKLHEGPQRLMAKRDKRQPDYARFKAISDRGDKPDKKTSEQGEQFVAVNDTLKEELPKLFSLTGKLMERCLGNFVQLQYRWLKLWKIKLKQAIDLPLTAPEGDFQEEVIKVVKAFVGDFTFYEGQVASLGVCNGSLLNDTPNLVQFTSPSTTSSTLVGDGVLSPRTGPSFDSARRTLSVSSDKSPVLPQPDFGGVRGSGSFFTVADAAPAGPTPQRESSRRMRASSSVSGNGPQTPILPGSYRSYSNHSASVNSTPGRAAPGAARTVTDPSPPPGPSNDGSRIKRLSDESAVTRQSASGITYPPISHARSSSPSHNRFSGFFSSAMPMSDSPPTESLPNGGAKPDFNVIFLAASVYEFNIDRARKEAGYPYLTYVAGEIFDVIGEKGELWLAKNQDDSTNLVGWIWNKHFVKLAG
ncbi:MAG: hypothetical protein Q9163_004719 [Psora crenata]